MAIIKVRDEEGNEIQIPAIKGKSAYQYALDGGYTRTEEEFAKKMASDVTIITMEYDEINKCFVKNYTYEEIMKHITDTNGIYYIHLKFKEQYDNVPINIHGTNEYATIRPGLFEIINTMDEITAVRYSYPYEIIIKAYPEWIEEPNELIALTSTIKADWNQNDESDPAHIKNRPFKTETTLLYDGTVTWDENIEAKDVYTDIHEHNGSILCIQISNSLAYTAFEYRGIIERIPIGGGSYESVARCNNINKSYEDYIDYSIGTLCWVGSAMQESAYNIIKMYAIKTTPIDEEYIPDNIARKTDVPTNYVAHTEQTLTEDQQMQARRNQGLYNTERTIIYSEEAITTLVFNGGVAQWPLDTIPTFYPGKSYEIVIGDITARGYCEEDGTITFDTASDGSTILYADGMVGIVNKSYTILEDIDITISQVDVDMIPEKYIPDTIRRVSDNNYNGAKIIKLSDLNGVIEEVQTGPSDYSNYLFLNIEDIPDGPIIIANDLLGSISNIRVLLGGEETNITFGGMDANYMSSPFFYIVSYSVNTGNTRVMNIWNFTGYTTVHYLKDTGSITFNASTTYQYTTTQM